MPQFDSQRLRSPAAPWVAVLLAPVWQWVLAVPKRLRYFLQRDAAAGFSKSRRWRDGAAVDLARLVIAA